MTDYIKLNPSALTFTLLYVVLSTALIVGIGFAVAALVGIPVSITWYVIFTSVWVADILVMGRHKMIYFAFSRVLNPNTGTSEAEMVVIREEARKMDRMIHHAKIHGMKNGLSGCLARESILFVYVMNQSDDEVLNHNLTLAFERQDAEEMAVLLGIPSQAAHLHSWLYECKA